MLREQEPRPGAKTAKTKPGLDARDLGPLVGEFQMKCCQSQHGTTMGTPRLNVNGMTDDAAPELGRMSNYRCAVWSPYSDMGTLSLS